jgi:predicted protein tyrosine phosphatase
MKLIIASRGVAGSLLSDPEKYPGITHVVSIGADDPLQKPPNGYFTHPADHKLRLEFFDISVEKRQKMNGPTKSDVIRLLKFYSEALQTIEPSFLIHCQAGKSRSTAAGLILLTMFYKDSKRAREELYKLVPYASPNPRMIKLANEVFYDEWKILHGDA